MPTHVKEVKGKWRVVDPSGKIVKKDGKAVDGGGHAEKGEAVSQAAAINHSEGYWS